MMEPIRRKFKSDISASNVDKLIEKRQRKRSFLMDKKPYDGGTYKERLSAAEKNKAMKTKIGESTLITSIPNEMLPKTRLLNKPIKQRELEKPENWIMPEEKVQVTRVDNLKRECDNILKAVDRQAIWSQAARKLIHARGQKKVSTQPSTKLTARGYISTRLDG